MKNELKYYFILLFFLAWFNIQGQNNLDSIKIYSLPFNGSYYLAISPGILIENKIRNRQVLIKNSRRLKKFSRMLKKVEEIEHFPTRTHEYYDIRLLCLIYENGEVEQLLIDYRGTFFYRKRTYFYDKKYFLDILPSYCEEVEEKKEEEW